MRLLQYSLVWPIGAILILFSAVMPGAARSQTVTFSGVFIGFDEPEFSSLGTLSAGPGGASLGGFNLVNDSTGLKQTGVATGMGDRADFSIAVQSQLSGAGGTVSWDFSPSFAGALRANHAFSGTVAANNPGSRLVNTLVLTFGSHLTVTDFVADFSSLNTRGIGWEVSVLEFLDAAGYPFSATPLIPAYLAASSFTGSSAAGTFVTADKSTVTGVGTNLTAAGITGPEDVLSDGSNLTSGATADSLSYFDVGLPPGTQIGGLRWTTIFEDVRGITNGSSSFTASFLDFTFSGTFLDPTEPLLPPSPAVVILISSGQGTSRVFIEDTGAMISGIRALPVMAAQRSAAMNSARLLMRDVNSRLFRLRSGDAGAAARQEAPAVPVWTVLAADSLGKEVVEPGGGKNPILAESDTLSQGGKELVDASVAWQDIKRWSLYASGDLGSLAIGSLGTQTGFATESSAASVGVERDWGENVRIGGAVSRCWVDEALADHLVATDLEGSGLSAYLDAVRGRAWGGVLYHFASLDHDISRQAGHGRLARGTTESRTHAVMFSVGWNDTVGRRWVTGPVAGIDWLQGQVDGYAEQGGLDRNLLFDGIGYQSLTTSVGWQVSGHFDWRRLRVIPQFRLSWCRENLEDEQLLHARLIDSPFYEVKNGRLHPYGEFDASARLRHLPPDYFTAGAGLQVGFPKGWSVFLDAETHFGRQWEESFMGSLRVGRDF